MTYEEVLEKDLEHCTGCENFYTDDCMVFTEILYKNRYRYKQRYITFQRLKLHFVLNVITYLEKIQNTVINAVRG